MMDDEQIKKEWFIADQLEKLSVAHQQIATGYIKNGSREMSNVAALARSVIRLLVEEYV